MADKKGPHRPAKTATERQFVSWYLREWRTKKGMTQQQLADLIDSTKSSVSQWESGKSEPDQMQVARIAGALGVDVWQLYRHPDDAGVVATGDWADVMNSIRGKDAAEQEFLLELIRRALRPAN